MVKLPVYVYILVETLGERDVNDVNLKCDSK